MGGGMRQAGYLAAACTYALENHIEDLKIDNNRAKRIGTLLKSQSYVSSVRPVMTNIIIFSVTPDHTANSFIQLLEDNGIKAVAFGPQEVRFVFHRDISENEMTRLEEILVQLV